MTISSNYRPKMWERNHQNLTLFHCNSTIMSLYDSSIKNLAQNHASTEVVQEQAIDFLDLGKLYVSQKRYFSAYKMFELQHNMNRIESLTTALILDEIGLALLNKDDLENALRAHILSLEIKLSTVPIEEALKNPEQLTIRNLPIANSFHNIGTIYLNMGKYKEASKFLNQSIAIRLENRDRSSELARSYDHLGFVYKVQGKLPLALDLFQRSVDIETEIDPQSLVLLANKQRILSLIQAAEEG